MLPLMLWAVACTSGSPNPDSKPPVEALAGAEAVPTLEERVAALGDCPAEDSIWLGGFLELSKHEPERVRQVFAAAAERCGEIWQTAWAQGKVAAFEKNRDEAADHYRSCLDRARRDDEPVGISRCAYQVARGLGLAADLEASRELYEASLAAAERAERRDLLARVHNSFAWLLRNGGEYSDALFHLGQAEQHARAVGNTAWLPSIAHNRGVVAAHLGNAGEASRYLTEAYEQSVAAGHPRAESAANYLGVVAMSRDEVDEAESWYLKIDPAGRSAYLREFGLGRVALARAEHAEAAERFNKAAEGAGSNKLVALTALTFEADAAWRGGELERATTLARDAVERSLAAGSAENAWEARRILGKVHLEAGRYDAAIQVLEQAIAPFEAQQETLDPLDEGLYFLRDRADPYVDLCAAIEGSGAGDGSERVLELMEAAQSRALRVTSASSDPLPAANLAKLAGGLAPGELLLSYLIGEDRGLLLAIRTGESRVALLPGARVLRDRVESFRSGLIGRAGDTGAVPAGGTDGAFLRKALLEPVNSWLAESRRMVIVPDREIARVPFAALPAGAAGEGEYLGESLQVAFTPLPSIPPAASLSPRRVLLAGDPVFPQGGFETLPWSAFELNGLTDIWGKRADLISGEDLTAAQLDRRGYSGYDVLHFSTHALASARDPRRSGIVLSSGERLNGEQVLSLPLDNALVVLSACRTGEGEAVPGQGVISLGWAFLVAGARGVVVSHWTADDASTARLMIAFHRELEQGVEPTEALARARRSVAERYPEPRHWAAFDIFLRP
ncbi:hypothetical protein ABI59_06635 [Acidobacteria bacterium Mor1]|nr:hypothetical protein ABI59_06635 [Acidobacteria bacterium Mor1]